MHLIGLEQPSNASRRCAADVFVFIASPSYGRKPRLATVRKLVRRDKMLGSSAEGSGDADRNQD
jgi:hypothetical protein